MADDTSGFPEGNPDERELLLSWLGYLRGSVIRKADGLSEAEAHWTPDGRLIPIAGVITHLTRVEWRWIDGEILGGEVSRSEREFRPPMDVPIAERIAGYRERGAATDAVVRGLELSTPGRTEGLDLRWVLLHLINETARHAGHADATRELLDGATGE